MFKAWLEAVNTRGSTKRAAVPPELPRADAVWVLGGLASASRRPAPRPSWGETVSIGELGRTVLDVGFKLQEANLAEFVDEATAQASARWFVWFEEEGALRLAAVLSRDGDKLMLAVPGKPAPVEASLSDVRGLAPTGLRFVPHVPADEDELERFGWRWFARAFFARKAVIRDIVIASLVVSLVGLAFPLATQAIVDKGYIYFEIDNRGSANRGVAFE